MSTEDSQPEKKQKVESFPKIRAREAAARLFFNKCEDQENIVLDKTLTLETYIHNHFKHCQKVATLMLRYGDEECDSASFYSNGKFEYDVDEEELRLYVLGRVRFNQYSIKMFMVQGSMSFSQDSLLETKRLVVTKADSIRMEDGTFGFIIWYKIERTDIDE